MQAKKYIFVCDERGTTRWPSSSKTWALGGFVIELRNRKALISAWEKIKQQLCGDEDCELKWSHFFPGPHQDRVDNPLLSKDPQEWRRQAIWAISELFSVTELLPINTRVRKDRASNDAFLTIEDGKRVLDINYPWSSVLLQFAIFLQRRNARGEVWFDQLGSRQEEARKQADWDRLRNGPWPVAPENQAIARRIAPTLKFFDSRTEPLVQIADFISGVIWAASEGDEEFLLNSLKEYFPTGPHSFSLISLE
jgi:hypothetical protein